MQEYYEHYIHRAHIYLTTREHRKSLLLFITSYYRKEDCATTKLRVVFAMSSKSDIGYSLGDILLKGSCVQVSSPTINQDSKKIFMTLPLLLVICLNILFDFIIIIISI